jgi:VIT1/CCC1 family predicted Fe2+/Mn2+ transporter
LADYSPAKRPTEDWPEIPKLGPDFILELILLTHNIQASKTWIALRFPVVSRLEALLISGYVQSCFIGARPFPSVLQAAWSGMLAAAAVYGLSKAI